MFGESWPPSKLNELRFLVTQDMSAGEIAAALHVTRGSVIGKCSREGLELFRAKGGQPRSKRTAKPRVFGPNKRAVLMKEPTKTFALPEEPPMPVPPLMIPLVDLEPHHCRAVIGDGAQGLFCGHDKTGGSSYCEHHASLYERAMPAKSAGSYFRPPRRAA
jgi:hypothetical protein